MLLKYGFISSQTNCQSILSVKKLTRSQKINYGRLFETRIKVELLKSNFVLSWPKKFTLVVLLKYGFYK